MPIAPWSETAPQLVDVAMGRAPADMLITNGRWVNVHSGEVIAGTSVAIKAGRFAAVGPDLDYTRGDNTTVIDAADRYLVPASATVTCTSNPAWSPSPNSVAP